jgi:phage major head subunit gpT-like protein
MPALTPTNLVTLETRMSLVTENEYQRLSQGVWWPTVTKVRSTGAGKEILSWLLSTAKIHDLGKGGNLIFEDLVSQTTEIEPRFAGDGLKLTRAQFEDTDGQGLDLAAAWSGQIGAQMAYWPQELATSLLMHGHDISKVKAYDKKAFFATDHPVNPYRPGVTFSNLFTGSPAGAPNPHPGALPIDESVSVDIALQNLQKLVAYVASIKMPNGTQPRRLRLKYLIVPPALLFRAVQLTQAKFIAQAAAGGGAAAGDVEALIASLGFALPIQADELAGFENDTTYFAVCEQITDTEIGGLIYVDREPFRINYYGPQTDAVLNRADDLEWHCKGRNAMAAGHPFLIFKAMGV